MLPEHPLFFSTQSETYCSRSLPPTQKAIERDQKGTEAFLLGLLCPEDTSCESWKDKKYQWVLKPNTRLDLLLMYYYSWCRAKSPRVSSATLMRNIYMNVLVNVLGMFHQGDNSRNTKQTFRNNKSSGAWSVVMAPYNHHLYPGAMHFHHENIKPLFTQLLPSPSPLSPKPSVATNVHLSSQTFLFCISHVQSLWAFEPGFFS